MLMPPFILGDFNVNVNYMGDCVLIIAENNHVKLTTKITNIELIGLYNLSEIISPANLAIKFKNTRYIMVLKLVFTIFTKSMLIKHKYDCETQVKIGENATQPYSAEAQLILDKNKIECKNLKIQLVIITIIITIILFICYFLLVKLSN